MRRRRVTFSRNLTLSLQPDVPLLLQVLRVRDPSAASARARRGAARSSIAAVARHRAKELLVLTGERPEHNAGVAGQARRAGLCRLHRLRRLGVRAGARARAAAAHQPRGAGPRGPGAAAGGHRVAGADARVGGRAADGDRPRRLADQAPGAADRDDRRRRRAEDPVHQRDPGRDRGDRGGADGVAGRAGRDARAPRPPPGGHPPELRPAPELLRAGAGRDRRGRRRRVLAHRAWRTGRMLDAPEVGVPGDAWRT